MINMFKQFFCMITTLCIAGDNLACAAKELSEYAKGSAEWINEEQRLQRSIARAKKLAELAITEAENNVVNVK